MPNGGEGPKGPTWKGSKSPEEVKRLNEEASEGVFEKRTEENRDALLAGIDRDLISAIREKCQQILLTTEVKDFEEAEKQLDKTIRTIPPRTMIPVLFSTTEELRKRAPVYYAMIASAFLSLTEGY